LPFRRNGKAEHSSLEAGYPHPAGTVRYVRPNANNPNNWHRSGPLFAAYLESRGVSDDQASYNDFLKCYHAILRAKAKRKREQESQAAQPPGTAQPPGQAAQPPGQAAQPPGQAAQPRGQAAQPRGQAAQPARQTYRSIMQAYEAAAPGDVLKLLAGHHMITTYDRQTKQSWDNLLAKSVQIVAGDGLTRDRVVVGITGGGYEEEDGASHPSTIAVVNADVRFAGMTLVCAYAYRETGFMAVREGGQLWLEGCEMRKSTPRDDFKSGPSPNDQFSRGVSVGTGASCFINGCVIDGAGGAGIEISPRATRVIVESSTVTGCAGGSGVARTTRMAALMAEHQDAYLEEMAHQNLPWQIVGECGAVEIEAWTLLHANDTPLISNWSWWRCASAKSLATSDPASACARPAANPRFQMGSPTSKTKRINFVFGSTWMRSRPASRSRAAR
jgi:hypothetical protein